MDDEKRSVVVVKDLYKSFKLPHDQHSGIKQYLVNMFNSKRGYEIQHVLDDISFEIKEGDFFGIVGRNGSGKSTLLKLLAGIYAPDKGLVHVDGSLTPFIELGVGFNPELTGRENVFMNGALLGFSKKEMDEMYDDIVKFSEIENFMDQKLKNYSSGMQVRLAFSIAIRARSDILLIDEVLAVGDAAFQQKCFDYFEKLKRNKQTIILVTHDMGAVKRFCNKALLLENGKIKSLGSPEEIASQYTLDNMTTQDSTTADEDKKLGSHIKSLDIVPQSPLLISNDKRFNFKIEYELYDDIEIDLGISMLHQGLSVLEHNTKEINVSHDAHVKHTLTYEVPLQYFNPGRFEITAAMFSKKDFQLIGFNTNSCSFIISDSNENTGGLLTQKGKWIV
jgi:ABC-2 type transport system ATP-binding protein